MVARILNDDATEWVFAKGVFDNNGQVLAQNMRARMEGRNLPDAVIKSGRKAMSNASALTPINFFRKSAAARSTAHC